MERRSSSPVSCPTSDYRAPAVLKRYNKTFTEPAARTFARSGCCPEPGRFMYEVTVEDTFAAGHYLRNYKGKCENPHGHNYKIRVTLAGAELDKAGLLQIG